ncbi:pescadillo N-terminus domain-containing protein [Theileria equi strain WA]|uniref:Pescadillo homolog n=1 Tax=Theileria equi strain WA TaxID=1537102 RepID=L0B1T2_THEEQ|nr:pescadillo N-terminus domain-containing protein [Theileria equi strain WA]AFZ81089.1 pescadillo N-terminus domain-containing protein [Theileria equi strain WA]|eukprot:XP_004830755.1 pescadillo N-terminus domain-containing protein [Theileria equi strain WA]
MSYQVKDFFHARHDENPPAEFIICSLQTLISSFSLSDMTVKKKANQEGPTKNFVTRTQALKKLQVSLKDFQRLCILKGVYPRDVARGGTLTSKGINRRKLKKDKIYYHINDIRNLASGDLLSKFRDISSHLKRFKRLVARDELYDAKLKLKNKPKYSLTAIVKQRCPSLISAVSDLDDAISTIAAVSALPGDHKRDLNLSMISKCSTQLNYFLKYVSDTGSLTKTFISIKGFYFQALILERPVTWIIPHAFSQSLPHEVDFKVIMTFVEYYLELLRLVNYKLYLMAGMEYPPKIKKGSENLPEDFYNFEPSNAVRTSQGLFHGLKFYVAREVPLCPTSLIILSCGGELVENPKDATHIILDRPLGEREFSCEYVQPQYIFDSLNCNVLLPVGEYAPGVTLPHHLSPFSTDDGYVPDRRKELDMFIKQEAENLLHSDDESLKEQQLKYLDELKQELNPELREMQKSLIPKKHRRLLSKIEYGRKRKAEAAEKLASRKKTIKK